MAQKTTAHTTPQTARRRPNKPGKTTHSRPAPSVSSDPEGQNEVLWEGALANSLDAIRDLADRALADRQAGRAKKITL